MSDKCTDEIKTKVPSDMADRWRARARRAGCSPSELLRDLICMTEHGMTFGELGAVRILKNGLSPARGAHFHAFL